MLFRSNRVEIDYLGGVLFYNGALINGTTVLIDGNLGIWANYSGNITLSAGVVRPYTTDGSGVVTWIDNSRTYYGIFDENTYLASNESIAIGTGDFTFEAYVNPTAFSSVGQCTLFVSSNGGGFAAYYYNSAWYLVGGQNGVGDVITSTTLTPTNTWTHVAIVRSSGITSIYIDGVLDSTVDDLNDYGTDTYVVGHNVATVSFVGSIANARISSVARYSGASFTLPETPFVSDADTYLLALNHPGTNSELTNNGVTFV